MAPTSQRPHPIIISGPSGTGKSTILTRLFAEYPSRFGFSVSHTTRQPRAGEQNGREYHFVTVDEFKKLIEENGFVEWAQFGGNYYGTSVKAIEELEKQGRTAVLDIEMEVCPTTFLLLIMKSKCISGLQLNCPLDIRTVHI